MKGRSLTPNQGACIEKLCKMVIGSVCHFVHLLLTPSTACQMVTPTNFSFLEIECSPLNTPLNGTVSSNNVVVETIVLFICQNGYEVGGQPALLCQESGNWNGTEPICRGV